MPDRITLIRLDSSWHGRRTAWYCRAVAAFAVLAIVALASFAAPRSAAAAPALLTPPPAASDTEAPPAAAPATDDLATWLETKARTHARALPFEARLLHRRGQLAYRAGHTQEAERLVRGAVSLDPQYLEPRWTLTWWLATRQPDQAIAQLTGIVELVRNDFSTQWTLAANAIYVVVQAWFLALFAVAILILVHRQVEIRHACQERFGMVMTPFTSRLWPWVLLIAPFAVGLGVALPVVAFLGFAWPVLRKRERAVFLVLVVSLAAAPAGRPWMDRLAAPMSDRSSLVHVLALEAEPFSEARRQEFSELATVAPNDPYVQFGTGWLAQQAGDLPAAEAAYRRTLELWPSDPVVLNDLGNALAQQGRFAEAIDVYRKGVAAGPEDATVHYNLSQAQTHEYDFEGANASLSKATALDFDRVRELKEQARGNDGGNFAPEWLRAATLWRAVREAPDADAGFAGLPPAWSGILESRGWPFSGALVLLAGLAIALGTWFNRKLPIGRCGNCDAVVCRRCAERRRAGVLCAGCARVAGSSPSPEFATVLLNRERVRRRRLPDVVATGVAMLVPAAGLVSHRRVARPVMLYFVVAAVLTLAFGELPFAAHSRSDVATTGRWLVLGALVPVYLVSILGHFGEVARARARAAARLSARARRPNVRLRDPEIEAARNAA